LSSLLRAATVLEQPRVIQRPQSGRHALQHGNIALIKAAARGLTSNAPTTRPATRREQRHLSAFRKAVIKRIGSLSRPGDTRRL
jgi:hypothetical protein